VERRREGEHPGGSAGPEQGHPTRRNPIQEGQSIREYIESYDIALTQLLQLHPRDIRRLRLGELVRYCAAVDALRLQLAHRDT
jgi:hypothetical protein